MKKQLLTLLLLFGVYASANAIRIDISQAGAIADGKTLNTTVIREAIDRVKQHGGGVIYFPAGKYLTGALHLCSNLTLEIESGAELIFSDNFDDYLPFVEMRYEGIMMKSFSPLLYATDAENITITGRGLLNGQGRKWWYEFYEIVGGVNKGDLTARNRYQPMWEAENDTAALYADNAPNFYPTLQRRFFRPPFIQFLRCNNIQITGVTIKDSPFWTINPIFCRNIVVDGVTIKNPQSPNTDGINPSSCSDVRISNCFVSVGDDCITIKSGRDAQGRRYNVPCENITVTNCVMHAGHGGVVIGSEMSGSVRNVAISNCVFDGTDRGIRIKSRRGRGGYVEAITVSNVVMRRIRKEAIVVDLFYQGSTGNAFDKETTPIIRNMHFSNITGYEVNTPIFLRGLEESPVSNVSFSNIFIDGSKEASFIDTEKVTLHEVYVNGKQIVK